MFFSATRALQLLALAVVGFPAPTALHMHDLTAARMPRRQLRHLLDRASLEASQSSISSPGASLADAGAQNVAPKNTASLEASIRSSAGPVLPDSIFHVWCFGDSITFGSQLTSPLAAYCSVMGAWLNSPTVNLAIGGSTSNHQDRDVFDAGIPVDPHTIVLATRGTNNWLQAGDDVNQERMYAQDVAAQDAWLLLTPQRKYAFHTGQNMRFSGPWSHANLYGVHDPGQMCTGASCSATFRINGSVLYLVTGASNSTFPSASAALACDGTATNVSLYFSGVGGAALPAGLPALQLARYTFPRGTANTTHECTVLSTGDGTLYLEWAAGLSRSPVSDGAIVLEGQIPDQSGPGSKPVIDAYRNAASSLLGQLQKDGLANLAIVPLSGVVSRNEYVDGATHPNEFGEYQIARAFLSSLNMLEHTAIPVAPYMGSVLSNSSRTGAGNIIVNASSTSTLETGSAQLNTVFGNAAGAHLTTASFSAMFGQGACNSDQTGSGETCLGQNAGQAHTVGQGIFVGTAAGQHLTTSSSPAIGGYLALSSATNQASYATVWGAGVCQYCIVADDFTGVGYNAGSGAKLLDLKGDSLFGSGANVTMSGVHNSEAFGFQARVGATGAAQIGTGSNVNSNTLQFQSVTVTGTATTFVNFPACSTSIEGSTRPVTDSKVNTYGATIAGGGLYHIKAYCNGTSWIAD